MIKIAICDDDLKQQLNIKGLVENVFIREEQTYEIIEYTSGEKLVTDMPEARYDIVLLDIDMPTMDGIEVANKIDEIWKDVNVVFVTNRSDLVFEALSCNPYRFIRKEYMEEGIDEAMSSLITKISNETYVVSFGDKKEHYSFKINDLVYIESKKHYVYFRLDDEEEYKIRDRLANYEKKLADYGFIKIHGSILVNVRKIRKISSVEVVLVNGEKLPISRSNSEKIKMHFLNEMRRHVNGVIV
ncbi:MAG: response regulator transcription factor [Lachnospiraceae bacterium]|nr:response regulator transcription factor [Lachnospiraceae bacterium]